MTDEFTTAARPRTTDRSAVVEIWVNPRESAPGTDAQTMGK